MRYKQWLLHRAKAERRKNSARASQRKRPSCRNHSHIVSAWSGSEFEKIIAKNAPTIPPPVLSIRGNLEETAKFIEGIRTRLNIRETLENPGKYVWISKPKSKRGMRRISNYADFSKIESISTAAALVLTAEYHRAARMMGSVPPVINLENWNNGVFWPMYKIGFFEAIGSLEESDALRRRLDGVEYLRAVSGTSGDDLELVATELRIVAETLMEAQLPKSLRMELNSAVGEAIVNVSKWAYPSDHQFEVPHLSNFWVTASAEPDNNLFTVVIYDQGVSAA